MCVAAQQKKYTLGIGKYPGRVSENFSPLMVKDTIYRNIALNRAAYGSSSYDYNLTAQLVTDGKTITDEPFFISVSTPQGQLARREREWTIDGGEYSRNVLMGEDTYLQYDLQGIAFRTDKLTLKAQVAYHEDQATSGYDIIVMASKDGQTWTKVGEESGTGLPGEASQHKVHSDPNKVTDREILSTRIVKTTIPLSITETSHLKLVLKMKGAAHWSVTEITPHPQALDANRGDAWMSNGGGEQWIYVDLGTKADFDRVQLHWIHKAVCGKVQVSDNAVSWTNLADLPGGKKLIDDIHCKASGRYVRVLMTQTEKGQDRYVLSEMQVMGRGGLKAQAAVSPHTSDGKCSLDGGDWTLQRASEVSASGEKISQTDFNDQSWIVATVPATVLTSYQNIGAIPNPNYSDDLMQISDWFFNSNFWYRREFSVPSNMKGKHVFLNLDGINWKANVYLNGKKIDHIDGAFLRGKVDITDVLKDGTNVLAIEVVCNAHLGAVKEKNEVNTDFNGGILGADNPTFHATIGWDWISTIRGRDIGIWNDVWLSAAGSVSLADPLVTTRLAYPDTLATVTPSVMVRNNESHAVNATVSGWIGKIKFEKHVSLQANSALEVTFSPNEYKQLMNQRLRLWWPNGYGEPYLYDAGFTVDAEGTWSDSLHYKAGIREMSYKDVSTQLKIYVNGRRLVPLGGNWGFSENNLCYRGREYDAAVRYHKEMNCNMIRDWVGQIGDDEFYQACDKYGIMVWQDFWLANPADGPDPYDEPMFLANARNYVSRIRRHASIGLYCGRNEGYPPATIDAQLRQYVGTLHPGIVYISSSADDGVSGHGPYNALQVKEYFEKQSGKLHSERGMPNVMTFEGLQRTLKPDQLWPQSNLWGQHDYTMQGAQRGSSFNQLTDTAFGPSANAQEFTDRAQWINYNGYRAMFESDNVTRMGLLIWMSHPCWPSMVWQTYDYYLEPTAAYFGVKKACEPLHIQWNAATRNVEIANLCTGIHRQLTATADVLDMYGKPLSQSINTYDVANDTTVVCMNIPEPDKNPGVYFIKLKLSDAGGKLLSDNFYMESTIPGNYQTLKSLPAVALTKEFQSMGIVPAGTEKKCVDECWSATLSLENKTSVPAMMVRLNLKGSDGEQILPVIYSDNYFSLMPGEKKIVSIQWKDEDTRGRTAHVDVTGFNVK